LVDNFPETKFIASGSAAAALRLKSKESGAGRFSDFMLPPLTFYEFLSFLGEDERLISVAAPNTYAARDLDKLNERFVDYLNFGGYPEAVLNAQVRANADQFIKNDIIDKVLLKDLPSLFSSPTTPAKRRVSRISPRNPDWRSRRSRSTSSIWRALS